MGDYFAHWLKMGKKSDKMPRIYHVNWFSKDAQGKYLWPGFGENCRVLKWIFERTSDKADAATSPLGHLPISLDLSGLNVNLPELLKVDIPSWKKETEGLAAYFKLFGDQMPKELLQELDQLNQRLETVSANTPAP